MTEFSVNYTLLDASFVSLRIVDVYNSILWVDRFNAYGEVELIMRPRLEDLYDFQRGRYLWNSKSKKLMIIRTRSVTSDIEEGLRLTVKGTSLEELLSRKIVWYQTSLSGNFQNGIKKLLEENVISPKDADRRIKNFVFEPSVDPEITKLTIDTQYTGDNLYEVINGLCSDRGVGFTIDFSDDGKFIFKLFKGKNRSHSQNTLPYVTFSDRMDNLKNTNFTESDAEEKNVGLVMGEGEGVDRKWVQVGGASGLDRREVYIDARDVRAVDEDGNAIPDTKYLEALRQRGNAKMSEYLFKEVFDGEYEFNHTFRLNEHFFLGDIIQVSTEYGISAEARVTEIAFSNGEEGEQIVPTFTTIGDRGEE